MNIVELIKKNNKIFTILLFAVIFIFGLFFIDKTSANFDEYTEQDILRRNVKDYAELIGYNGIVERLNNAGIPSISVDIEKDHGIAPYYLFTPILFLRGYSPYLISFLWKLYTYCIFFIGVVFLFLLIKYLFKDKKMAFILSMLYLLSPRIFIDGLNNNKDIVLMSLIIVMIYFFFRLIKENKFKFVILFSIVAALVCNIKIIGIFFTFVLGIAYFIYLFFDKKLNKQNIIYGILTVIITFILFVVITPAIWGTGKFLIIDYVKYCLDNSVSFRASISVLFEGISYVNPTNPLPWYYLPKMICITLPILIPILFIFSLIIFIINVIKRKISNKNIKYLIYITFIMFIVPFLIAIFKHPNIYNGWRHFYFLYAFIIIISSYGLSYLFNNKNTKKIIIFLVIITLSTNVFYLFRDGVANTAYYNFLVGNKDLSKKYELDYYHVTSLDAIEKFINSGVMEENIDGKIYLYGDGFNSRIVLDFLVSCPKKYRDKIVMVTKENKTDYVDKIIYDFSNLVYQTNEVENYELVYSYKINNSNIISFYKM